MASKKRGRSGILESRDDSLGQTETPHTDTRGCRALIDYRSETARFNYFLAKFRA